MIWVGSFCVCAGPAVNRSQTEGVRSQLRPRWPLGDSVPGGHCAEPSSCPGDPALWSPRPLFWARTLWLGGQKQAKVQSQSHCILVTFSRYCEYCVLLAWLVLNICKEKKRCEHLLTVGNNSTLDEIAAWLLSSTRICVNKDCENNSRLQLVFSYDHKRYSCKLAAQAGIKLQPPHWRGRGCGWQATARQIPGWVLSQLLSCCAMCEATDLWASVSSLWNGLL